MNDADRSFLFFGGDSWPADRGVERELRFRLGRAGARFIGHDDIMAGEATLDLQRRSELLLNMVSREARHGRQIVLIGRSSGARIITASARRAAALALGLCVVALAYPFKHPELDFDPERVRHLATLPVPTLLVQGDRDIYGGEEMAKQYAQNADIEIVQNGHDLDLNPSEWNHIADRIVSHARKHNI